MISGNLIEGLLRAAIASFAAAVRDK